MVKTWLSVTAEPERELPVAVATLIEGGVPSPDNIARERERVEGLILRGNERSWHAYLHRVVRLLESEAHPSDELVARAHARARAVIANHHNLLLALPGRGAEWAAADREWLARTTTNSEGKQ